MRGNFLVWAENQAQILRRKLLLSPTDNLDPFELAKKMGIIVITPYDVLEIPPNTRNQLLVTDSDGWSAGAICLANGKKIVVMNPTHAITRRRITLMEEISHIHLNHKPSVLKEVGKSLAFRDYKQDCEKEAYWVGAASLLPRSIMFYAQQNEISKSALGKLYTVSERLVTFRENLTHIKLV
jgi:hypothetical protein